MGRPSNAYERFIARVGHKRWFSWFGRHILTPLDRRALGHSIAPTTLGTHFPLCYLTTRGARTGHLHTVPLLFVRIQSEYAVAATNFGAEKPPAWSVNLDEDASAELYVGSERFTVTARRADPADEEGLWARFDEMWPPFATYRRRASRAVPIYVLAPEST